MYSNFFYYVESELHVPTYVLTKLTLLDLVIDPIGMRGSLG